MNRNHTNILKANIAFKMRVDKGGETKYLSLFQGDVNSQEWVNFHETGKILFQNNSRVNLYEVS